MRPSPPFVVVPNVPRHYWPVKPMVKPASTVLRGCKPLLASRTANSKLVVLPLEEIIRPNVRSCVIPMPAGARQSAGASHAPIKSCNELSMACLPAPIIFIIWNRSRAGVCPKQTLASSWEPTSIPTNAGNVIHRVVVVLECR